MRSRLRHIAVGSAVCDAITNGAMRKSHQPTASAPAITLALTFTALAFATTPLVGTAHEGAKNRHIASTPPAVEGHLSIPDVTLLDQDGNPVQFYSDLVKGKVVVLSFIYTQCTTICTPIGFQLGELQRLLDARTDMESNIVSVSIDPTTDTPTRLKEWSRKFAPGPRWKLVTGRKPVVNRLLKALSVFYADFSEHSPTILIGNDASGKWFRASGLAPPSQLLELVARVSR